MDAMQYTSLYTTLAAVPDPRHARGQRYRWPLVLTLVAAALLSGQKSVRAIAHWTHLHAHAILACLPDPPARLPSRSTFDRALQQVNIAALEQHLAAYHQTLPPPPPPPAAAAPLPAVAVDGKSLRGVRAHGTACHLVSVVRHGSGLVLDQERVAAKTNEITCVPRLLARHDLHGVVVTIDALLTQRAIARQIRAQEGHYLMVVKENQPELYAALKLLFEQPPWGPTPSTAEYDCHEATSHGHGRLETRRLERSAELNDYLEWPGVGQVLRRTCVRAEMRTGKCSVAVSYGITSLSVAQASAAELEALWRGHWTIENQVHYVRDETFGEDRGQVHTGSAPEALAALRNSVLSLLRWQGWTNIADALREYAASVPKVFGLILGSGL